MLTTLKYFLRLALPLLVYISGIFVMIATVFKRVEWGLFLMIILIPQPNIWYKFFDYPMGKDFMDLLFLAIFLGIIIQKKGFAGTRASWVIILFILTSYISVWNSSMRFSLPMPLSRENILFIDWKNYAQMIFLYILALNVIKDEKHQKTAILLMTLVILLISVRSYRNFTGGVSFQFDKRVGGPFETVGLGPNHLGAFIAEYCAVLVGIFLFDKERWRKVLFIATALFGLHPLFFSYSRGAYAAALGTITFFGIFKKRTLLIGVAVILLAWTTVLPSSVVDRIMMTETASGELEGSASHRFNLWEHAYGLFEQNPVFGIGFGGFGFTVPEGELTDTHNFYMKTLSEQGVIGLILLLIILIMAMRSGWRLYRTGTTPFHQGLGFGFMGTIIACMIANVFGDRWSYFVLGGYFWILWGLVDRGILMAQESHMPDNLFAKQKSFV